MRKGIRLNNRQFDEIDALRNTTASADIYRNCSVVLLSNGGHTISGVAEILGAVPRRSNESEGCFETAVSLP